MKKYRTINEILGRGPVHPFPARMAADLVLDIIAENSRSLRILDPMSGSGTVLAVARSKGHRAIGVDIDPLAVLISRVWTTPANAKVVKETADKVLSRSRHIFSSLRKRDAYPIRSEVETQRFIRYWFDDYARRQLASLSMAIREVRDERIRDILWCAFSRLIITKQSGASLAMDLSHSRPHRTYNRAPTKPFRKFLLAVNHVVENCVSRRSRSYGPTTRVYEGDARRLPLKDNYVDLVLTSPPYLNAIDYLRCSKFSLVWMGYQTRDLSCVRAMSVGAEIGKKDIHEDQEIQSIISKLKLQPKLRTRQESILARYIDDMRHVVRETARVLNRNGKAVYVVGENTVRGTFVPNSKIIKIAASTVGLHCFGQHSRNLPENRRYLPPPSLQSAVTTLDGRIRREVILKFRKVA